MTIGYCPLPIFKAKTQIGNPKFVRSHQDTIYNRQARRFSVHFEGHPSVIYRVGDPCAGLWKTTRQTPENSGVPPAPLFVAVLRICSLSPSDGNTLGPKGLGKLRRRGIGEMPPVEIRFSRTRCTVASALAFILIENRPRLVERLSARERAAEKRQSVAHAGDIRIERDSPGRSRCGRCLSDKWPAC